ncbi:hypothetical protein SNN82_004183, partial [Cronobacter sakazakii]|nr:hypothetical protein [Cronobacter sakazakii]
MLKASTLFTDMEKRIKKIKTKYMGRQVRNERTDPVNYTFDRLNTAAYRLLVHAELEGYIEAKASEILALIKNDVVTKGYATAYLKNILAIACHLDEVVAIEKPYDEQDFIRSVLALIAKAEKKVKDNNGIKKNSFKMLALFSGYDVNAID